MDTLMEYHLHIDTSKLSDYEWAMKYKQLQDIKDKELKASEKTLS